MKNKHRGEVDGAVERKINGGFRTRQRVETKLHIIHVIAKLCQATYFHHFLLIEDNSRLIGLLNSACVSNPSTFL